MNISVLMPQLGLTMEEGTVSAWLKKAGEVVKKGEPIFSVTTDKVEMEVEAVADGTLGKIIVQAGDTVPVGTVLGYLESASDDVAAVESERKSAESAVETGATQHILNLEAASSPVAEGEKSFRNPREGRVSPRARRLAKELGVVIAAVKGSGDEGQINEEDIRRASSPANKSSQRDQARRQLIAERLTRSVQTIPAFSVAVEVNAENFLALYENLKQQATLAVPKLTVTDLLLVLFARTLKGSPEVNATWEDNAARNQALVNVGLAVATEKGVVAPVIRDVDVLDLQALVKQRAEIVEKTRHGRLSLTDLEGGVGTLSNLGIYRVDHFQAIISPGQSSILAVGQIRNRPWVDKELMIKPTVMLNFTVDHRVVDGAAAAVFLGKLAESIESPPLLSWGSSIPSGDGTGRRSNA